MKSRERVATWSAVKASRGSGRPGLQTGERRAPPPRNPERSYGWRGGVGNHPVSLGATYAPGKACQQLIKAVGGGEIVRGKSLEAQEPV